MSKARKMADLGAVYNGSALNNRNLIKNGSMLIASRTTSKTGITAGGYYTVDLFSPNISNLGTYTMSQETDAPAGSGLNKSLKMACTVADTSPATGDVLQIQHKIEGQDLQHLYYGTSDAKTITLSFWVKSNVTGTYNVRLYNSNGTDRVNTQTYTIDSGSTWEKKVLKFEGDTARAISNTHGTDPLNIAWWLAAGSTFTSGTVSNGAWKNYTSGDDGAGHAVNLSSSTSNTWQITGVQLEVGEVATPFEVEDRHTTLRKVQRYIQLIGGNSYTAIGFGQSDGAVSRACTLNYIQEMRTSPSFGYQTNSVANTGFIVTDRTAYDEPITSFGGLAAGVASCQFNCSHASRGAGETHQIAVENGDTSHIILSAEL